MSNVHTVVLDWDGTLVTNEWPGMGTWQPGAIQACQKLHAAGIRLVVFSARLSPWDPFTFIEREPAIVAEQVQIVRGMLDDAGLTYVDIWTLPGKPGGDVYVDDKAERYNGTPRAWDRLTEKILVRLGKEDAAFPAFDQEVAGGLSAY
jgi:hypothetical protein